MGDRPMVVNEGDSAGPGPPLPATAIATRRVDITPEMEVVLGAGPGESTGVLEPLEANVLAIESQDLPVVMLTLDLLYPGSRIRAAIEAALPELPSANLLVGASHSHRAPMTAYAKPGLGRVDDVYLSWAVPRIVDAVVAAVRELEVDPCAGSLWLATGHAAHSVNRRRLAWRAGRRGLRKQVMISPNREGVADESITLAIFVGQDSTPLVAVWNYACHPVGYPVGAEVSAHFPHIVRDQLRAAWGLPDLPVLFFQGFSGNTRPSATVPWNPGSVVLRTLFRGNGFRDMSTSRYLRWAHSLAATVCELVPQLRAADVDQVSVAEATRPLDLLVEGAAPEKRFEVRGVRIGTDWMVMGVNAEAVADYALWLRGNLADRALMLAGCMDDTYGYLPTDRMIDEGGYEGGSFCPAFGLDGVRVGGEAIARSALSEVATSLRTPSEDPSST